MRSDDTFRKYNKSLDQHAHQHLHYCTNHVYFLPWITMLNYQRQFSETSILVVVHQNVSVEPCMLRLACCSTNTSNSLNANTSSQGVGYC